jgi:hypothetical protein
MQYLTTRHKKLMDASEYALKQAADNGTPDQARIASTVLANQRTYRTWENVHANLMQPVARHWRDRELLLELRKSQLSLVHHRALFRYLANYEVRGDKLRRLLRLLHGTLDFEDALLHEHRRFLLAVSSRISSKHIARLMNDADGEHLVKRYASAYDRYLALKCEMAIAPSRSQVALIRPCLNEVRERIDRTRRRIVTSKPTVHGFRFETQEALSRSGRYKAINYLNA